MRNLKKVLALALATVMLLGIMAIASAADYTDEAAIADKYAVAVDVMTAIGVFEGDPSGNFNPAAKLTREQAAKIAVYVALTKDSAKHITAVDAPFSDVAAARWSAGSIIAAKNLGLIDGWNGKFDPTGDLTGYAFAKMMLGVLGYKAENEGFLGAGWEVNVNLMAREAGLLKGMTDVKMADTLTREQAAQMAFNALQAKPVVYKGGTNITIGDVTFTSGGTLENEKDAEGAVYADLAAKLYPTLTVEDGKNDFGYATKVYKYGTTPATVATGANYEVLATYAGDLSALTNGALYALTKTAQAYAVYVNGDDASATVTAVKDGTAKQLAAYTGAKVEVVKNAGAYQILITKAVYDTVDSVTAAAGETKRYITIGDKTFTTENFAKDDKVLVYANGTKILKVEAVAETAYGALNQVAGKVGAVTGLYIDGTKYPVAGSNMTDLGAASYTLSSTTKQTAILVNGYVVALVGDAVVSTDTLDKYVYVAANDTTPELAAWGSGDPDYFNVQVVYMDGTVATLKAKEAYTSLLGKVAKVGTDTTTGLATLANPTSTKFGFVNFGAIDFEDKVYADGFKVYPNADSQYLTMTYANGVVKTAKVAALPTEGTLASSILVYAVNADAAKYDVKVIIPTIAVDVEAETDLYYVNGSVVTEYYDATAKKTYQEFNAYELATGNKIVVKVEGTSPLATGVKTGSVTNGVYAFGTVGTGVYAVAADTKDITVYNGLATIEGQFEDVAAAKVVVVDTTTNGLKTIEELAAKNATKAVSATLYVKVTATATTYYVVVTAVAK